MLALAAFGLWVAAFRFPDGRGKPEISEKSPKVCGIGLRTGVGPVSGYVYLSEDEMASLPDDLIDSQTRIFDPSVLPAGVAVPRDEVSALRSPAYVVSRARREEPAQG